MSLFLKHNYRFYYLIIKKEYNNRCFKKCFEQTIPPFEIILIEDSKEKIFDKEYFLNKRFQECKPKTL